MSKSTEITAANFDEYFPLDYAVSLCAGLSNIDTDSAVVTRLVEWCQDRGYYVTREVCRDVLESQAAGLLHHSDGESYFETAQPGNVAYLCDDDRYCHDLNAFESWDDFGDMCEECHGKRDHDADLIRVVLGDDGIWRGGDYAVRIIDGSDVRHA